MGFSRTGCASGWSAMNTIALRIGLLLAVGMTICPVSVSAQGIYLPSLGPVNRGMGGAAVAAPVDPLGALYWNPASISGLESSQMSFGMEFLLADTTIDSTLGPFSGSTGGEPGVVPIPEIAWVQKTPDPRITLGLAITGVAGFKTNFPASTTNPVLTPQSNTFGVPGGLGSLYTEAEFYQLLPTISFAITDRLSIGLGPTVTMGKIAIDPMVFVAPDDADGSGGARYPEGRGTRYAWGGGAQLGVYYITEQAWHFGASIKSPQWMEPFRFHSQNEVGGPRTDRVKVDLPMVVSVGAAYSGFDRTVLAMDVRYFDHRNADGFGDAGFNADGSVAGLGWRSVFSVASGIQHQVSDMLTLRAGYSYNQNPVSSSAAFFNLGSPLYYQHLFSVGATVYLTNNVAWNMGYSLAPESEVTGPMQTPFGALPGGSVTSRNVAHLFGFGATVQY